MVVQGQRSHLAGLDDFNVRRVNFLAEDSTQAQGHLHMHGPANQRSKFVFRGGKSCNEGASAAAPSSSRHANSRHIAPYGSSSRKSQQSNLENFVQSTTPSLPWHHLPKSKSWEAIARSVRNWSGMAAEGVPYFNLPDVWEAYAEWSVYGCGVPLSLNSEENVVQYYVPYLSALQLYTRRSLRRLDALRRCDDGESCESEYKDSSSEASDSDGDRNFPFAGSDSSSEPGSDSLSVEDEAELAGTEWDSRCHDCREKHRLYEYFEHATPYSRVPLSDKVAELQADFPSMKNLRSVDIHPASWFSVAWYPVYRIPTGPTLRDLGASFLTYHSLSTRVQAPCPTCSKNLWNYISIPESATRGSGGNKQITQLSVFGLADYKLKGPVWFQQNFGTPEKRCLSQLQSQADRWLKRHQVHHPDFEFFRMHR